MPPCPSIASQLSSTERLEITHRPNEYHYSEAQPEDVPIEELEAPQYYRLRKTDKQIIWEWVSHSSTLDPQTHQPWKNTFILQALIVHTDADDYYYDGEEYVWEEFYIPNAEAYDADADRQQEMAQMTDQHLLQQYETELLAIDIIQKHLSEEADNLLN